MWKSSILPLLYYGDMLTVIRQHEGAVGALAPEEHPLMWDKDIKEDSFGTSLKGSITNAGPCAYFFLVSDCV